MSADAETQTAWEFPKHWDGYQGHHEHTGCGNGSGGQTQTQQYFTTQLSPDSDQTVQIWGETTPADSGKHGGTLLLLLSGSTYDHRYWDMPGVGSEYSFVDAAHEAGYATLNLDRLGVGNSSKPSADQVTIANQAYITHQIIDQVRDGALGQNYDKIVLVGHSLGSRLAMNEAGIYNDVDGVVLTGRLHTTGPTSPDVFANLVEASTVENLNLPPEQKQPGYLTTAEGARTVFYNTEYADPNVIAQDEATRQTVATGELATPANPNDPTLEISDLIKAPVLSIVGAQDTIFVQPGGVPEAQGESAYFDSSSSHQTIVVPNSGHDLQLSLDPRYADNVIFDWVDHATSSPVGERIVTGGKQDDVLAGDNEANHINGGRGNDGLAGEGGFNILTGGKGADTFYFGPQNGTNVITDFHGRQGDRLDAGAGVTHTVSEDFAGNTVVTFSDNHGSATLLHVSPEQFHEDWIV